MEIVHCLDLCGDFQILGSFLHSICFLFRVNEGCWTDTHRCTTLRGKLLKKTLLELWLIAKGSGKVPRSADKLQATKVRKKHYIISTSCRFYFLKSFA